MRVSTKHSLILLLIGFCIATWALSTRQLAASASPSLFIAPANDMCSGAEVVPNAGPFPYLTGVTTDITDATVTGDPPLPSCQTNVSRSIWYTFTPATTATYEFSTCADAPTATTVDDTVMAIYTSTAGCGGTFTEILTNNDGCDDDSCGGDNSQAVLTAPLTAGTPYFIVVWQFGTTAPPTGKTAVQLRVTQQLASVNDTCATAIPLTLNTPVTGTTAGATNDYTLSGATCFSGVGQTAITTVGRDVVYSFTAPAAGNYSFRADNYSVLNNLVLYVATSCPAAPQTLTCSNMTGPVIAAANRNALQGAEEVLCLPLTASQQVFIFVDEATLTDGSSFTLEASVCLAETEPNNSPASANSFAAYCGIEGSINPAGDADFYALETPVADSRIFALVDSIAGNTTDLQLRVTTATDTLEFDDDNGDTISGALAPIVAGTRTSDATTYLRVNSFSNAAPVEPYRLYAVVQPPSATANAETEPNDTTAQADANAIITYVNGAIAAPTDNDIFRFTAISGEILFIALDGDPTLLSGVVGSSSPINGGLALLNSAGTPLVVANDLAAASSTVSGAGSLTSLTPNKPAEGLVFKAPYSGTFYVRVTASGAGDYLLSIARCAAPTAVKFTDDFAAASKATRYDNGALVQWSTTYEVDNLGFNLYREEAGRRQRINSQIIAGSALMVRAQTTLGAGKSYTWFDNDVSSVAARYWIEDIDLSGRRTLHGPIPISDSRSGQQLSSSEQALLLNRLSMAQQQASGRDTSKQLARQAVTNSAATANISAANLSNTAAVKIVVAEEGLYRVTQAELIAAGLDAKVAPAALQMFGDGQEIPILVKASRDSYAIEFYGIGHDSPYTKSRTYWLAVGTPPSRRIEQVTGASSPAKAGSFPYTVERRDRSVYFSSLRNGERENFFGAVVSKNPTDQSLTVQHLEPSSSKPAILEIALQGVTATPHRVQIEINGNKAGDLRFAGQTQGLARLAIAPALLREGQNSVRLVAQGGDTDISLVDYLRLTYSHRYTADNNALRLLAPGRMALTIDGFTSNQIRVLDVTDPNAPQEVTGSVTAVNDGYAVSVMPPAAGDRTVFAFTANEVKRPVAIRANAPSNWRESAHKADMVIITRREFTESFKRLAEARQKQGLQVVVVDIEDLYNEFSFGNKTPQAVKDFLLHASKNWQSSPRYVLFGGDASYDPNNYLGYGDTDFVPTRMVETRYLETASDDWFADFDGDGLAEMAVGRLPVRTEAEAGRMVAKIIAYKGDAAANTLLLVSDSNDGFDFASATRELRDIAPINSLITEIDRGRLGDSAARAKLLASLSQGQGIVNYNGHGSLDKWRGNLLTAADAGNLTNNDKLSLFITMTCLNGYFQDVTADSLAESLLKSKGGAFAVLASSGLTSPGEQAVMNQQLFRLLFNQRRSMTLGEVMREAKATVSDMDIRKTWLLFGDPTMRLQ